MKKFYLYFDSPCFGYNFEFVKNNFAKNMEKYSIDFRK